MARVGPGCDTGESGSVHAVESAANLTETAASIRKQAGRRVIFNLGHGILPYTGGQRRALIDFVKEYRHQMRVGLLVFNLVDRKRCVTLNR